MYSGLLIKESISDEKILDLVEIINVEIWKTDKKPKYWTAITFNSNCIDFPEKLSKSLTISDITPWYVDMKKDNTKYIITKDNVFKYKIGNDSDRAKIIKKCIELGIPKEQLEWAE